MIEYVTHSTTRTQGNLAEWVIIYIYVVRWLQSGEGWTDGIRMLVETTP